MGGIDERGLRRLGPGPQTPFHQNGLLKITRFFANAWGLGPLPLKIGPKPPEAP